MYILCSQQLINKCPLNQNVNEFPLLDYKVLTAGILNFS